MGTVNASRTGIAMLVALVVGSSLPVGGQPADTGQLGDIVYPIIDPVVATVVPILENETAQDLSSESIRIDALLDIRSAEYNLVGILFGGGRVQVDADAEVRLEIRGVGMERLDEALRQATGEANITVRDTFGIPTHRLALTAEEIRLMGGGVLLEALQGYLERVTREFIESTTPGLSVLRIDFSWSHTLPLERPVRAQLPDLREPPLTLDAKLRVQYLERLNLVDVIQEQIEQRKFPDSPEEQRRELKQRIRENQTIPFLESNAFSRVGYHQLLDFEIPPGWAINATLSTPTGFTFESVTDELYVDEERQTVRFVLDGDRRTETWNTAAVATLSNRFTVTSVIIGAVFAAGITVRLLMEAAILWHLRSDAGYEES